MKVDAELGFILEVILLYLKTLHKLHNDFSLLSEQINISKDMLPKNEFKKLCYGSDAGRKI